MTCETAGPTDKVTLACITSNFSPASALTFQWKDSSGRSITDFITYPAVQSSGSQSYRSISQVTVDMGKWDARSSYTCSVTHPSRSRDLNARFQKPVPPKSPTVTLLPVYTQDSTPDTLICSIRDFYPKSLGVTWRVNGRDVTGSSHTWFDEKQASNLYSASSMMNVDRAAWDRNEEYKCEVQHLQNTFSPKTSRERPIEKPSLEVTLNPPKVRQLFISSQAVLDCIITGGEKAAVEGARVIWTVNGKNASGSESQTTQDGRLFRKTSTLTLAETQWFSDGEVQCSVKQINSKKPPIPKSIKPMKSGSRAPTVILSILSEEGGEFATLMCLVTGFTPRDVYVMWKVDNDPFVEGVTTEPVRGDNGTFSVTSLFKVPLQKWKSQSEVGCHVKHSGSGGTPTTKSLHRTTDIDKPSLEVTLNPPKVRQLFISSQAVLDCIITGGEKAAVEGARVIWTVNGKNASGSESQTTQDGRLFRKTSTLTLAETQWFSDGEVQCSVKQINSKKPPIPKSIKPMKSGSRAPTVILSILSEEGGEFATLMCLVTGFTPRDVYVMWKVDNDPFVEGVTTEPVRGDNGTFSVTSLFKVPLQKWKSQSEVGCHVKHSGSGGTPTTKSLHRTTDIDKPSLEVTLNPPKVRQLFISSQAVLDCIITGGEKAAVEGARVIWTVNGKNASGSESQTTQDGRLFRKTSTLTLAETQWFSDGEVQCSVKQINSKKPPIPKSIKPMKSGSRAPTVILSILSEEDAEYATLMCLVTGFTPREVYVMWKVDNDPFVEGVTTEPVRGDSGTFSVTSLFKVPLQKWKSQSEVGCHVKHSGSGGTPTTQSLHRTTDIDKPGLEVNLNSPKMRKLFINNQAVLDCIITGGEKAAVEGARITWTVNGKDSSGSDSKTTQNGRLFRKTSTLTLAETQWFSDGEVQCSVKQINSTKPPIKKMFNLIKSGSRAPTVILSILSEEDGEFASLMCLVTGFTPRDVYVMWKVDNDPFVEGVTTEPVRGDSGTFSVTSFFKVPLLKWKSNSEVGCHVKHSGSGGTPTTKSLHRTTDINKPNLEVTLNPPKVRQLFMYSQAVLDCIITGGEKAAVEGARVIWTVNGENVSGSDSQTTQDGRLFRKTSTLTLAETQWFSDGEVQCSVKQINSKNPPIPKSIKPMKSGSRAPTVIVSNLSEEDAEYATLMCLVTAFTPLDVYVMWKVDNGPFVEGVTTEPVRGDSGTFSVTSLFKVPLQKWKSQSEVGCHVKHSGSGGTPTTNSVFRVTDIDKPGLEVNLNPPKMRQLFINNQAVLDCIITGGEKAAVEGARVTWTVNGKDSSGSDSQTTQNGRLFRKTSTLTLAETQWFSDGEVQCSVKQINSTKPPIKKIFNLIKSGSRAPTVILSILSEEDGEFASLMCLVTGFTPRDVYVMWKVDNDPFVEGVTTEPVRGDSGTFSVTSFFKVPLQKWKSQSQVGCHVKHMGNERTPTTNSVFRMTDIDKPCLEVTLNPPKVRQLFINNQAVLDCIITGGERVAVDGARVTWTVNGKDSSGSDSKTTQDGRLFRKTSTLTLAETQWFSDGEVQCSVKEINSKKPPIKKSVSMIKNGSEGLKLFITEVPQKDDSNFVTLMCVVTYFPPQDIYVMWRVSDDSYEEGVTSKPVWGDNGTFSVASMFRVPTLMWETNSRVGCHVKHMINGGSPNMTTISKEDVSPLETESVLHCNDEGEDEDELGSLWSTTLSFITLFLCSLIYSTIVSLNKMKYFLPLMHSK